MSRFTALLVFAGLAAVVPRTNSADATPEVQLTAAGERVHIRNTGRPEWSTYPESPGATEYRTVFSASANPQDRTLRLTQHNVKEAWEIQLNGTGIGQLLRDENAITGFWVVPAGCVREGDNELVINSRSANADDIEIESVAILPSDRDAVLKSASIVVNVTSDGRTPLPSRITILDDGRLMTPGAASDLHQAVRPGVIYCNGTARFGLPAGTFTIVAGRGPEYGIASVTVTTTPGSRHEFDLSLEHEAPVAGFVSCDTHIHTLTHSGHGDASVEERMLTIAGEHIELAIATDHNKHIDYSEARRRAGLQSHFTAVIGNEVTTRRGHFNVFPVRTSETPVPDHAAPDWETLGASIRSTPDVRVVILNHGRDIHSGFRPLDPSRFIRLTGRLTDGEVLPANAMEVINSAAQQSDMMSLVHDWMGLMTAGVMLTPVGSSDSHDVARHFVGQGRTYIRCQDDNPGAISVANAVDAFLEGRVTVSCGLFAGLRVNGRFGPGDLVPQESGFSVTIEAAGPSWAEADRIELYRNGILIHAAVIPESQRRAPGLKHSETISLSDMPRHDCFLVAVVRGPGVSELFWPIARPYQATSPNWTPQCLAVTGAAWLDGDGDGQRTPAIDYARRLCAQHEFDAAAIIRDLQAFDDAVAAHVAEQLLEHDEPLFFSAAIPEAIRTAPKIAEVFVAYRSAWQQSQTARLSP